MSFSSLFILFLALVSLSTSAFAQTDCAQTLSNGAAASAVYGQSSFTTGTASTTTGLSLPDSVAIDPVSGSVFVADQINNRVLRYPSGSTTFDIFFGNPSNPNVTANTVTPAGLTFDSAGNLYVSDQAANRVLVFKTAGTTATSSPNADVILGQTSATASSSGSGATQFSFPEALYYDTTRSRLFVADSGNGRVVYFNNLALTSQFPNPTPNGLIGATTFVSKVQGATPTAINMNSPFGLGVDSLGNLWVSDFGYNRVTRYPLSSYTAAFGATADNVLGQNGYTSSVTTSVANNLNRPYGLAIDTNGDTLYVADSANDRVVVYFSVNSAAFSNPNTDRSPSFVFGQSSVSAVTLNAAASATTLNSPQGVFYYQAGNQVLISDANNNRVLRYCGTAAASPSPAASGAVASPSSAVAASPSSAAGASGSSSTKVQVSPVVGVSVSQNLNVLDLCVRDGKGLSKFQRKFTSVCTITFGGTVVQAVKSIIRKKVSVSKNFLCCTSIPQANLQSFSFSWKGKKKSFRKLHKLCRKANGAISSSVSFNTGVTHYRCTYP